MAARVTVRRVQIGGALVLFALTFSLLQWFVWFLSRQSATFDGPSASLPATPRWRKVITGSSPNERAAVAGREYDIFAWARPDRLEPTALD
jgi:hypothetical protein